MFKNREYVLEVYKEKSFSEAAKNLYISQPSLSASVKRIEEKTGAPIFDRSTQPVTLTEIGEQYIKCAMEIERLEDSFKNFVNERLGLIKGEIKIGGSSLFSSYVLPPLISKFNALYPKIHFRIIEDNTKNLMSMLLDGEIDLVLDNAIIENENIFPREYKEEMLLLAVPKKLFKDEKFGFSVHSIKKGLHKTNTAPCIPLETFKDMPFIFLKQENDTGRRAKQLCKKHGFTPKVLFELDQQVTAHNISLTGMGISFVSDTLIEGLSGEKDILYYKLSDSEINRNIYFYVKSNRYLSTACKTFIDVLSE